ncbi:MAG: squalene synthase HpnC [Armatimonadetes bacterium]|nr:squalene synthase HpnC [Armatimonadota bacterium]
MSKFGHAAAVPVLDGFDFKTHSPEQACALLAKHHYENFTVGSILLPRELRKHVFNIYAYCRICDDLADETNDRELSLRLLDWWREELHSCYECKPRQSVFQALAETIDRYDLPMQPFEDLIDAFVQDQHVTRYATFEQLLHYCSRSANPVGRLFLCLLGYRDETRQQLSDYTCSALQLANFWQDIGSDYLRGRIYVPQEDMQRFGYTEAELRNHILNAGFVHLMRFEINRTREFFEHGASLPAMIGGSAAADVELFSNGGLALLQSIERQNFDVFRSRVTVSKSRKAMMMAFWCIKRLGGSLRRG